MWTSCRSMHGLLGCDLARAVGAFALTRPRLACATRGLTFREWRTVWQVCAKAAGWDACRWSQALQFERYTSSRPQQRDCVSASLAGPFIEAALSSAYGMPCYLDEPVERAEAVHPTHILAMRGEARVNAGGVRVSVVSLCILSDGHYLASNIFFVYSYRARRWTDADGYVCLGSDPEIAVARAESVMERFPVEFLDMKKPFSFGHLSISPLVIPDRIPPEKIPNELPLPRKFLIRPQRPVEYRRQSRNGRAYTRREFGERSQRYCPYPERYRWDDASPLDVSERKLTRLLAHYIPYKMCSQCRGRTLHSGLRRDRSTHVRAVTWALVQ